MFEKKVFSKLIANKAVQALGYTKKELRGIAKRIADNLNSTEDKPDEEVDAEIDERIETYLPFLAFGQAQANRLLDAWKKEHPTDATEDDADEDDEPAEPGKRQSKKPDKSQKEEQVPAWAKQLLDSNTALKSELEQLKGSKLTDQRKQQLQAILKDTGVFGERTLKQFSRLKFEDDDDFNDYLADVELDIKALNQERADKGLSLLGKPAADRQQQEADSKPYSDEELKGIFG